MAFPDTPQDLLVEAYLGGEWRDITGDVRDDPGITIVRGASAEGSTSAPSPSTCSLTLDNSSGDYTPRNPAGTYFGALGRNTPMRVTLGIDEDTFSRTESNGWGSSDTGQPWTTGGGAASDFAVGSGAGTHVVSSANSFRRCHQAAVVHGPVDVAVTVTLGITNITGADVEPANIILAGRDLPALDYVMARVSISTAEAVTISIQTAGGTVYGGPLAVDGLTHTAAQSLRVRAQSESGTVRMKVWPAADPEPAAWQLTATTDGWPSTGWIGVRSGVASGNTNVPVTFSYDDWEVRSPRWAGEVAEWPVASDTSGNDVTTAVTGAGLIRRLSQRTAPLRSAMYRAHLAPARATPVAYWSMEDGADATSFGSAVGGPAMVLPDEITPSSSVSFPASDRVPVFGANTVPLVGTVGGYTSTGTIVVDLLLHVPSGGLTDQARLLTVWIGGSTIARWIIYYATGGNLRMRVFDADVALLHDSGLLGFAVDDRPLRLSLTLTQDGSDVDYDIATASIGEAAVGGISGTVTSQSLGRVTSVHMGGYGAITLDGLAAGHLAIKTVEDFDLWESATQAWAGETAGDRIARLCEEEGIGLVVEGDPGDTEPMGPQSVTSLLELVEECAAVDGGLLAEPAGALGLLYRTRVSLYSQDTRVTLDQTAGELLPPLEPVDDDRYIANEVTVTRDGGSSATAVQTTGPLAVTDPPDGVGRYDTAVTLNLAADEQAEDQAAWRRHLGTIDEARFPSVRASLAKTPTLRDAVLATGLGDRLGITHNRPSRYGQAAIDGLVLGYTEQLSRFQHEFDWTLIPASGYAVGVWAADTGDTGEHLLRWDADGSTLVSGVAAGGVSMSVATPAGPLWTTVADDFPMQVIVGGITVTVTAITGASSPQTFAINPAPYALPAGAEVSVATPGLGL